MQRSGEKRLLLRVETNLENQEDRDRWRAEATPYWEPPETEREIAIKMFHKLKKIWRETIDAETRKVSRGYNIPNQEMIRLRQGSSHPR